jgi:FkbM family methyltransferase
MNFNFTDTYDGKGRMPDIPKRADELRADEIESLVGQSPFLVEIGCNDGETTEEFLRHMPYAEIVCFECDPSALDEFRIEPCSQVSLVERAAGHRNGEHSFFPSDGRFDGMPTHKQRWNYSGGLTRPTGHLNRDRLVTFRAPITVSVIQVDGIVRERVDFIWCDSQGSEARVILGARDTLLRTRYFYTEFYDTPQYERQPDLYGIYCMLPDFDPIGIFGDNCLFKNRDLA